MRLCLFCISAPLLNYFMRYAGVLSFIRRVNAEVLSTAELNKPDEVQDTSFALLPNSYHSAIFSLKESGKNPMSYLSLTIGNFETLTIQYVLKYRY